MKKTLLITLLLFLGCQSTTKPNLKTPQSYSFQDRFIIAVPDFENETRSSEYDVFLGGMSDLMIEELLKFNRVRIVERTKLDRVLDELALQATGLTDPDSIKQVGKHLGVDALLIGSLNSVTHTQKKTSGFLAYMLNRKTEVVLSARLVNVETSEVLLSSKASRYIIQKKKSALGFAEVSNLTDEIKATRAVMDEAIKQLANDIAERVPQNSIR
jgi:curli biogenesis system outer membrane secretion channel CsgG